MTTAADLLKAKADWRAHLRALYTDAIAVGLRVTAWAKGSPTRAVYYCVARAEEVLIEAVRDIANQGFRSTAAGDALTLVAREVFGIERPSSSHATTTVLITNTLGGNYVFGPRELVLLNSAKNKQYVNLGEVAIGPLAEDIEVGVVAVEPGSASTALPGDIDSFVTAVDGLIISQPTAAIGLDSMSDADLLTAAGARVGFIPTESTIGAGGAPGAYESIVRVGPDGKGGVLRPDATRIAVTRAKIDRADGAVTVYVADADGGVPTDDVDLLDAAVKAYAASIGISAVVYSALTVGIPVTYTSYVPASSSAGDEELEAAAEQALLDYFGRVPVGGYELETGMFRIPLDGIRRAIANAQSAIVGETVAVTVTVPADDFAPSPVAVPVLVGEPTATIKRVPGV